MHPTGRSSAPSGSGDELVTAREYATLRGRSHRVVNKAIARAGVQPAGERQIVTGVFIVNVYRTFRIADLDAMPLRAPYPYAPALLEDPATGHWRCTHCRAYKPPADFAPCQAARRHRVCRPCATAHVRAYRAKQKMKNQQRADRKQLARTSA